ncbi:MAG: AhpC/TSA family protein [Bacteroidales bacterium]|nr:AhpC/TSA family protein [Bacteroidales bacterium]
MKKILMLAAMLVAAVSCTNRYSATVSGNISGLDNSQIVLEKLNYNKLSVVDTVKTDGNGDFRYKVSLANEYPAFYYIYRNGVKLAGLVLSDGDKVVVNADTLGSYSVSGSAESESLKYVDDAFAKASAAMVAVLDEAPEDMNAQLSRIYVNHKRDMLKHIMSNPRSITAATTLFQKFNDDLPLFNESTDIVIFRSIYDSLASVYPYSEYVLALKDEITQREKEAEMNAKFDALSQQSFPEINMNDIAGNAHSLLSLEGNVIILSFWSIDQTEHKLFNQELSEIYDKYHDKGLEIYQVSLDVNKASWAATVRSQNLPWISVNDGLGVNSPAVIAYNLEKVPSMFVIGRDGDILARDVFETERLEPIIRQAL